MKIRMILMTAWTVLSAAACARDDHSGGLIQGKIRDAKGESAISSLGATSFAVPPVEIKGDVKGFTLEVQITGDKSFSRTDTTAYKAGALAKLDQLEPGAYHLVVSILNAKGEIEYTGATDILIAAGEVTVAKLTLLQVTPPEQNGGVILDVDTETDVVDVCGMLSDKKVDTKVDSKTTTAPTTESYSHRYHGGYFCAVIVEGLVHVGDVRRTIEGARKNLLASLCYENARLTQNHVDRILCVAAEDDTKTTAASAE